MEKKHAALLLLLAISSNASSDKNIYRRVGLAAGIVRNLHNVWKAKDINQ